jgi:hypothetical protein
MRGGAVAGAGVSAVASSPEIPNPALRGVNPSGALAWEDHRFMRDPLGPFARVGDGRSGVRSVGVVLLGGAHHREPVYSVLGSGLGQGASVFDGELIRVQQGACWGSGVARSSAERRCTAAG